MVMEKKTWSEKQVNLSSAIIIGFVLAVVGGRTGIIGLVGMVRI